MSFGSLIDDESYGVVRLEGHAEFSRDLEHRESVMLLDRDDFLLWPDRGAYQGEWYAFLDDEKFACLRSTQD